MSGDDVVAVHDRSPDRLVGEAVGDELGLERRRVGDDDVALAGLRVGERLTGAHRDVLERVLRVGGPEAGDDHVVGQPCVARVGRRLHDDRRRAGGGGEGERAERRAGEQGGDPEHPRTLIKS